MSAAFAQVTYLPLNTEENQLLDKLETRSGRLSDTLFLATKPVSRKAAVDFAISQRENARYTGLSNIDRYNIQQLESENGEWTPNGDGTIYSKHPWFHTFYQTQYDFIHVKTDNFFVVVNPIISGEMFAEKNSTTGATNNGYWTSRGAELRGWICKKIGFYASVTDNQEKVPTFVNDYIAHRQAVPGADYYLNPGNSNKYDYLLATGYFDFAIIKDHLNASFGYGKNFIGDGINSIFLSDFSSSMPFLRLNTRIWKINYENLYTEATPQYHRAGDTVLLHKYITMHRLSINATKWLNVGLFESIVYGRNQYEIAYLNPIIFLGSMEQFLGSADKKHLGLDFKAVALKHVQVYGQFLLDEFKAKSFFSHDGWFGNKWALQLGGKYYDAFTVKNLDIQAELNVVRPYTYTHSDTVANYTNYNQPLADPIGNNFIQLTGIVRYQPVKKVFLTLKGMYYRKGNDTGNVSLGGDIFKSYGTAPAQYGVFLLNGVRSTCKLVNLNVSYELRPNLFIDLGATHRIFSYDNGSAVVGDFPASTTTYGYLGVRLNIARRDYDFY